MTDINLSRIGGKTIEKEELTSGLYAANWIKSPDYYNIEVATFEELENALNSNQDIYYPYILLNHGLINTKANIYGLEITTSEPAIAILEYGNENYSGDRLLYHLPNPGTHTFKYETPLARNAKGGINVGILARSSTTSTNFYQAKVLVKEEKDKTYEGKLVLQAEKEIEEGYAYTLEKGESSVYTNNYFAIIVEDTSFHIYSMPDLTLINKIYDPTFEDPIGSYTLYPINDTRYLVANYLFGDSL